MGSLRVGKHVLVSAPSAPLELDGIPFRSEAFVDGEYLRFLNGQIITGPGGGGSGGSFPTRPFRVTSGGVVEYNTIQAAIDAASADDLIYVPAPPSGTYSYNEQITVNKQVSLIGIGGKRCRIIYETGPVVTVSSNSRITGFWIEAVSGPGVSFIGGHSPIIDDVETGIIEIALSSGFVIMNLTRCYELWVNSVSEDAVLYATKCEIVKLVGNSTASHVYLNDCYLNEYSGSTVIHHSGGTPANFPPSEQYRNYNIPWATEVDSHLVYRRSRGYWFPEPLPEAGGGGGGPHHATHEHGGTDEINVNNLSGRLADYQKADQIGPWPVDLTSMPQDGFVLGWSASQGKIVWLDPPQLSVSLPLALSLTEASTQSESGTITIEPTQSSVPG